jgi:hypothetical protein
MIYLENDRFNYNIFLNKALPPTLVNKKNVSFFLYQR